MSRYRFIFTLGVLLVVLSVLAGCGLGSAANNTNDDCNAPRADVSRPVPHEGEEFEYRLKEWGSVACPYIECFEITTSEGDYGRLARILEDEATAAAALAGGEESATVIADFYYPQGARYAFAKGLYLGNKGGAPAVDWKFIFSDTGNNQEYPKCRAYDGDWGNTYIMKR